MHVTAKHSIIPTVPTNLPRGELPARDRVARGAVQGTEEGREAERV